MKRIHILFFITLLILSACKQDVLGPAEKDNVAPGQVTNLAVVNLNGAAKISYELPADRDLLYVKALYTTKQGVKETKVSRFNSSLTVEGFGDTAAYQVSLYAVDKSENASAPVQVTVHPLTPAVKLVRDSLELSPDFGGVNVKFTNHTEESLAIIVLANDSLGQFSPIYTHYTNLRKGDFSVRNRPSVPTQFGVYVRDRWGNLSDTLIVTLTPLFEELLDRTKMKGVVLPTDAPLGHGGSIAGIFDGNTTGGHYHSSDAARMPQWFTFDMGVTAKLSRLTWFMRPGYFYSLHNPRVIEIWGSNNPSPDGSFDASWTLLTAYTQIKPSGLPEGQLSQADTDAALAGETLVFPLDIPKVRYIRFKTLKNWSNGTYVNFYELMLWGDTH
ncbi:DUF4959 domain-containing protein [Pseudoflavitalea sp. X16]|uniref:DUF5000 domain-containing lipoprotein n=1 Tax=Paraflavitalea devenefica TaxID=2716334 RepID=UPI001420E595|nr:DUF5000 domain-containing lipoprotein [Paraflavitalea devenefica]NII27690.1 DUF4959 domain-containing protein [Paraflavitalea devenefica]